MTRLGHVSSTLLNKLVSANLVRGLPKVGEVYNDKVCDACAKGKQTKSSFKAKKEVTTFIPVELIHMDLCGPIKMLSKEGKKFFLVVDDEFFRYT